MCAGKPTIFMMIKIVGLPVVGCLNSSGVEAISTFWYGTTWQILPLLLSSLSSNSSNSAVINAQSPGDGTLIVGCGFIEISSHMYHAKTMIKKQYKNRQRCVAGGLDSAEIASAFGVHDGQFSKAHVPNGGCLGCQIFRIKFLLFEPVQNVSAQLLGVGCVRHVLLPLVYLQLLVMRLRLNQGTRPRRRS